MLQLYPTLHLSSLQPAKGSTREVGPASERGLRTCRSARGTYVSAFEGKMAEVQYALSVKQPWAALLVHGRKSIEIRTWPTARRGRILIHATRVSDPRPEAWDRVPSSLMEAAQLVGGFVGAGEITECRPYRSADLFAKDRNRHLNDPKWFRGKVLYGFVFTNLVSLPFRSYPGWVRFFPVDEAAPE